MKKCWLCGFEACENKLEGAVIVILAASAFAALVYGVLR